MIDTVLFDLDGTLLPIDQSAFMKVYFRELSNVFAEMGLDGENGMKALLHGTKDMLENDGTMPNSAVFWRRFSMDMGIDEDFTKRIEEACDEFYSGPFNLVRDVARITDASKAAVMTLKQKGYRVILATNPLFPPQAITTRLGWFGLEQSDFELCTDYHSASYCKPSKGYFDAILSRFGLVPGQCLMVGNNVREDMCAREYGMSVYLVDEFIENEDKTDISDFNRGRIEDFAAFAGAMPRVG